ncbi:sucrose synthase 2-like [Camellia sinensis]|uniref:sucrose synthase 2-like n=1 Tax=Camellia sinensis TaxID=4442 RepID=UPI001035604E|nr:sucrose synthase 2-like [Camellia sinensis]
MENLLSGIDAVAFDSTYDLMGSTIWKVFAIFELGSSDKWYVAKGNGILQHHQLIDEFENVVGEDGVIFFLLAHLINTSQLQEAIVLPPFVAIAIRPRPGVWEYVRVNVYELCVEQLSVSEYLRFKENLYNENFVLELDFEPFNATFPRPTRLSSIGNGVQFLNHHLSSIMFRNKKVWSLCFIFFAPTNIMVLKEERKNLSEDYE